MLEIEEILGQSIVENNPRPETILDVCIDDTLFKNRVLIPSLYIDDIYPASTFIVDAVIDDVPIIRELREGAYNDDR